MTLRYMIFIYICDGGGAAIGGWLPLFGGGMHPVIVVFMCAVLTLAGDYLLKVGSLSARPYTSLQTLCGALLYFCSAFGWVFAMRRANLTVVATTYSALTILVLTGMSFLIFKEAVSARQLTGAGLALVAVLIAMK
jgi:drug/metabolite transporter (DMT)-like permease